MDAVVNKIIPFSSVDGPGNRTAIFLQGCNIDCKYCHNPETRKICIACGKCVHTCPGKALEIIKGDKPAENKVVFHKELCIGCDNCIHNCPHDSSPRTTVMNEDMVMVAVRKQMPFIRGITVSGGECMQNAAFLEKLFRLAKDEKLSTMIDTNGTIDFSDKEELLKLTDGVMLDIKAFDEEAHRYITGATNDIVLKNAVFLAEQEKLFEVRVVVSPNLYDAQSSVRSIAQLLKAYNQKKSIRIKLISYRPMGVREAYKFLEVPGAEYMNNLSVILEEQGFSDVVLI